MLGRTLQAWMLESLVTLVTVVVWSMTAGRTPVYVLAFLLSTVLGKREHLF